MAAVRSALRSFANLLANPPIDKGPATHVGIATDHIIKSFRNDLFDGYKDGSGIPEDLKPQFELLEKGIELAGFKLWAAKSYEADDALASAAHKFNKSEKVKRILIHTPDKDLAQCVTSDNKVVQYNRRYEELYLYKDIIEKFEIPPESIADYLALVGDTADGIPGLAGFGAKSASAVLQRYEHIENIPKEVGLWDVAVRGADKLSRTFNENYEAALLYKKLATLIYNVPEIGSLDDLKWKGIKPGFEKFCESIAAPDLYKKLQNFPS